MKIIVLLSATFFGFTIVCQDLNRVPETAAAKVVYVEYEEPVATIALDTVEVVYKAPAPLAAK